MGTGDGFSGWIFLQHLYMSEVSFYILDSDDDQQLLHLVCNLVSKAYTQATGAYVLMKDMKNARALDELLWTYPPDRFLPHRLADEDEKTNVSIIIGDSLPRECTLPLLVNAKNIAPPVDYGCDRVFDIVQASQKEEARIRYTSYRKLNYVLKHHEITQQQLERLIPTST